MKIYEMKKGGRYGIGFVDPNTINQETWSREYDWPYTEKTFLELLVRLNTEPDILLPYNFRWVTLSYTTNSVFAY